MYVYVCMLEKTYTCFMDMHVNTPTYIYIYIYI